MRQQQDVGQRCVEAKMASSRNYMRTRAYIAWWYSLPGLFTGRSR